MRQQRKLAILAYLVVFAACGGKVVADGANAAVGGNGAGGTGASMGTAGAGNQGGASCFNPPDPATLTFCGGSVGAGGSGPCIENDFCDNDGNIWSAICTANACQCLLNNLTICTCAPNEPSNFCSGSPTCCPLPKI